VTEKYLTKKRAGLLAWFQRAANPLAETYESALRILKDKHFPDRVLFIAHAVREINNSLPELLAPASKRGRLEYGTLLDKIIPNWSTIPSLDAMKVEDPADETVKISMRSALQIDSLIQAHNKSKELPAQFDALFKILMSSQPSKGDINLKIIKDFRDTHDIFVGWSKKRTLLEKPPSEEELHKQFNKFEDTLYSFVGNFFSSTERLDELLKKGIQPGQMDEILPLIASPHHEAYFFNNLNDCKLIPSLTEKGMFEKPFKTESLETGGIRYPIWPPSKYLARMAHTLPDEIAAIFSTMDTDNASVIRDIVTAALSLPATVAIRLVPRIRRAAEDGLLALCFEDAVTLCIKLIEESNINVAERLAISLFTPRMNNVNIRSPWYEHQYRDGLVKIVPALTSRSESSKFLTKLCIWLHLFIESEKRFDSVTGRDYSDVWRPAIEEHVENQGYHRACPMVTFVRDGFELSIGNKKINLESTLKIIDKQKYLVFKRIKLHLINKFAENNPQLAREAIMDRNFFEQCEYKHEYAKLVECRFSLLGETEQNEWFSWIERGPLPRDLKDLDSGTSEEKSTPQTRYWKYGKLHWARLHLKENLKEAYEALRLEFRELILPDLNISLYAQVTRDESLIQSNDFSKSSIKEVVKIISEWRPFNTSPDMESGIKALTESFQKYVSAHAKPFSAQAKDLISCPAIFVRNFIIAMTLELKMGNDINIRPVLDLCLWVISRPIHECTTPCQKETGFIDKDWQWTRSEIALFIRTICQSFENDSPKYQLQQCRTKLWNIISSLCYPEEESFNFKEMDNDPRSQDYIEIGINSLQGKTMEAAFEYARWVYNYFKKSESKIDFAEIAEVRELIESRIIAADRTPGELAIIGSNIHLLYAVDKHWLEAHADVLFPLDSNEASPKSVGWAAWNAFLSSSRPHIEFFKLFKKQFAYAAEKAVSILPPKNSSHNPVYRLGEHLIILYMKGDVPFDEKNLSIRKFLSDSTQDTRLHTIEFVGRLLERHDEVSEDVTKRCMGLWISYWADSGEEDARTTSGFWPFSSWLSCRRFQKDWSLEQFEKYLQISEVPEISNQAMDALAEIADADIKKAVNILYTIVQSDKEGWHIPGWQDSIYSILEKALTIDSNCNQSQHLVDYLGRSGYMKFKNLVP